MKIVLIEDDPDCYDKFQLLLEDHDHNVQVYDEADAVIDDIQAICKADVIILDLMMQLGTKIDPNEALETGIAIYNRIRKIAPPLPIVVLTARSRSEVWDFFKEDPKVRYLGKPVSNVETFYKTIEVWS